MVNANNGADPSSESFLAPDGSYVPRILFLDPQGKLLEEVINEKVRQFSTGLGLFINAPIC